MKKYLKALGLWLAVCLCLITLSTGSDALASEKDPRVLKVAFPEAVGINEVYEDGTYGGCVYDWLEEIAKYTGWKYEFVTGDPNELMHEMEEEKYDLMGGVYFLDGLDELYNFPEYIMGSNYSLLIYRQEDQDIKGYDHTTLNGKRIGVWKRAVRKIERLEKFLDINNVQYELIYFEDQDAYEKCLETQAVDLMLGSDVHMKEHYNVAAKFEAEPYYIVTAKDEPELCKELSSAMESIYAANPNFAKDLYNQYFPDRYINSISFTAEEQEFIRQSGPLKVAVQKDCYPLFFVQEDGIKGIIPDCLELISKRTGLTFQYQYADTYQEQIDLVKEGKADIIGAYRNSDVSAAEDGLVRTVSFASLDSVILRNKQSIRKSEGLIMAVPKGQDLKPSSRSDTILYYEAYRECLEAVNSGEADYTRMPAAFIEDFYSKYYYVNIALAAETNLQEELTLALTVPVKVPLYSVLSKAINNFSDEESEHILLNNSLALRESTVTVKSLLYSNPIMVIGISVSIILLISVIVVLLNFNRTRARVMQLKLEKAEEMGRAKSDFLSRMSHEIRTPMNAIIGLTNLTRMTGEVTPAVDETLSKIESSAKFLLSLLNDVLDMSKIDNQKMKMECVPFDLIKMVSEIKNMFSVQAETQELTLEVICNIRQPFFVGDKMRIQQVLTNLFSNACKFTDKGGTIQLVIEEQDHSNDTAALRFSVRDTGIGINQEDLEQIFRAFEQAKESNLRFPGTGLGLAISSSLVELMGGELKVKSKLGSGSEFYFTILLPVCGELPSKDGEYGKLEVNCLEGLRVLLAEDNDINAEIVTELLESQKVIVDRVADGKQAAELFAKSPEGTYKVILMDINMPVMDGLTAARMIRSMNRLDAGTVPILAMTANTFQEDRDNAANAGMTGFLPKPFDVDKLYQILLESLEEKTENKE